MIEYLDGKIVELNPAHAIVDVGGVGYFITISLNTYSALTRTKSGKLFIHEVIREDAHNLFGFSEPDERVLFRNLISVSGIGPNTGILFLSSLSVIEIKSAIVSGDFNKLKTIKGVGLKTAQRLVVELKDKLGKEPLPSDIFSTENNTTREEALSALVTLGFVKKNAEKIIDTILKQNPQGTVEQLIKDALKQI
jgi:holliday junction DNA helicase RuvA